MDMSVQRQGSNGIFIPLQEQSTDSSRNMLSPQNQYYQPNPILQAPQQQIIVNQPIHPKVIYIDASNLKTSPNMMGCPYCKSQITTEVRKKWNLFSCIFCLWAGLCCWAGMQFCRDKEINCYDAEHFCPVCHNKIGDYSSC